MIKLHTVSRDNLFSAEAVYVDGQVTVLKGSHINMKESPKFKPSEDVVKKRNDRKIVNKNGFLKEDVMFDSLSAAANFVTGRIANGMIAWKTDDGEYVRNTLIPKEDSK